MEEQDRVALARVIVEELRRDIPADAHSEHHAFISMLIKERAERIERRKRIEERIAGSLILSATIAVVTWVGHQFLVWLKAQ